MKIDQSSQNLRWAEEKYGTIHGVWNSVKWSYLWTKQVYRATYYEGGWWGVRNTSNGNEVAHKASTFCEIFKAAAHEKDLSMIEKFN